MRLNFIHKNSPSLSLKLTFDNISNADLLIGGSSGTVANWNTFFDLPTLGTSFSSVSVTGNVVNLYGGANITLKHNLFDVVDGYGVNLLGFEDNVGCIVAAEYTCFGTDISGTGCPNLISINFPSLITVGGACFSSCTSIVSHNFPNLVTLDDVCFAYNLLATSINLPVCTTLGTTVGDDYVFLGITGNTITLTIPSALMTCNGGNPDGDIVYLQSNNTVTIIQV